MIVKDVYGHLRIVLHNAGLTVRWEACKVFLLL